MDKFEYLWMIIRGNYLPADITGPGVTYEEVFSLNKKGLVSRCNVSEKQAEYILEEVGKFNVEKEYEKFLISGASAVTIHDERYPNRLKHMENRPYALFYYGELPHETKKSVAIIGARNCSEYGRIMAENIAADLAKKNINIISGMAYGIDGISQAAAINAGGRSYGVLGSGVNVCYPRANKNLYEMLIKSGGIISEYPIDASAKPDNFPQRNRIISGLSDLVLVVEAKIKSGTFITVDYALSQGKEIMVVPGRATDPLSVGCNALISQGANPAQSAGDIIRLLDTISLTDFDREQNVNPFRTKQLLEFIPKKSEKILLEREENMVYSVLDFYSQNLEDIQRAVKLDVFQIMNALISLELKGLIKETGKNSYVKCR